MKWHNILISRIFFYHCADKIIQSSFLSQLMIDEVGNALSATLTCFKRIKNKINAGWKWQNQIAWSQEFFLESMTFWTDAKINFLDVVEAITWSFSALAGILQRTKVIKTKLIFTKVLARKMYL